MPGGDLDEPMGEHDSCSVFRDLAEMEYPYTDWCGFLPEGHPAISDDPLFEASLKQGATHGDSDGQHMPTKWL